MSAFTKEDLRRFQAESLDDKIQRSFAKISEWYLRFDNEVYVSFSGGKDSTVLADLCAKWCSIIGQPLYLVFVNTGLEYPEIQKHVKVFADYLRAKYGIVVELEILRPQMRFDEVIKEYGYPMISKEVSQKVYYARKGLKGAVNAFEGKMMDGTESDWRTRFKKYKPVVTMDFATSHQCCHVMKKKPAKDYEKQTGRKPIIATMAEESNVREKAWLKNGCNAFNAQRATSQPMSFWTEQDVLHYIKRYEIPIASVYGDIVYEEQPEQMRIEDFLNDCGTDKLVTTGCTRTGCIFCGFGCHLDKSPSRFEMLKETHPRQYEYCIGGGEYDENGVWKPNKKGLGMGHVFEELNKVYGEDFIKYK